MSRKTLLSSPSEYGRALGVSWCANATYTGEEQCAERGVDDVQDLVADEHAEEGEEDQHDQAHKQNATAGSEVILGLCGSNGEGDGGREK